MIRDLIIIITYNESKTVLPLFLGCFYPILFILAGNDDMQESSDEFKFGHIRLLTAE